MLSQDQQQKVTTPSKENGARLERRLQPLTEEEGEHDQGERAVGPGHESREREPVHKGREHGVDEQSGLEGFVYTAT